MRLEYLEYFARVAQYKSINKAAKELFITQPALTSALQSLEEELGFKLFSRSYQGVLLTPNGQKVLEDAQKILSLSGKWKDLANTQKGMFGQVHIVANPAAYSGMVMPIVLDLQTAYPEIDLFPYEAKNQNIPEYLLNNTASIGILSVLEEEEKGLLKLAKKNNWQCEKLYEDYCCVFISTKNPLAQRDYLLLKDLSSLVLAMYPEQDDTIASPVFSKYFAKEQHFRLSNLGLIMQMITEDRAAGVFPNLMMSNYKYVMDQEVKAMPVCDFVQPLTYYVICRKQELLSEACQKTMELVKEYCRAITSQLKENKNAVCACRNICPEPGNEEKE